MLDSIVVRLPEWRRLRGLASVLAFAFGGTACSSSDAGTAPATSHPGDSGTTSEVDAGTPSRLSADAVQELTALGAMKYRGKAVITGEEDQSGVKRVSFDPASGPICFRGATYAAFYLDRGSPDTMILLDGGGACWSALCSADDTADATILPIGPASADPSNYFHTWNVVFAPYCDGSVFSGDNDYPDVTDGTHHYHGRQNLAAALDLAVDHFPDSKRILLAGFSAGGYGTLPGMLAVRLLYPQADLFVMDDSGPGLQNLAQTDAIQQRLTEWKFDEMIPDSCTACDHGRGQLTALFPWFLERDSTVKIALLSYFEDPVIGLAFNGLDGPSYKALLTTETDKVHSAYPDRFERFMVPGTNHVVSQGWGTLTGDGVRVDTWVTAMVEGPASTWTDLLAAGP